MVRTREWKYVHLTHWGTLVRGRKTEAKQTMQTLLNSAGLAVACVFVAAAVCSGQGGTAVSKSESIRIGAGCRVAPDPRQPWSRFVRFRPGDRQVVTLNPPRFSWPYMPTLPPQGRKWPATMRFTLQISAAEDFLEPAVEVKDTDCNFYNFLPQLRGSRVWYWRVGYRDADKPLIWSDTRRFDLADDVVGWDRSRFAALLDGLSGHPRILFNSTNRASVMGLRRTDAFSRVLAAYMISSAEKATKQPWYRDFPESDSERVSPNGSGYLQMARSLTHLAFAYQLTGEEKYAGFRERFLRMASWGPGGCSAPEGMAGNTKWNTHLTEFLGLFYDWSYHDLSATERTTVRESLEWRIAHTLDNYAWRIGKGSSVRVGSIAVSCSSHPYENIMVTMAGALAICDESPIARKALDIGLHYIVGITSGHGEDEGWNEGPGYGNGKMKWLMDASAYLQVTCLELQLGRNEAYSAYADFFARITPLGARHSSFGNRGRNERDWGSSRVTTMRRVAMLCGNGQAMQNWLDTRRRLTDMGVAAPMPYSPWIDYVLPHYATEPVPVAESATAKLFPLEGWVTVSSASPSDYAAQQDAVSMTFHCRPRGGYSHSFRNENAFDLHAYGQTLVAGGGTTSNQSHFANHTMSHNTILVNGHEQVGAKSKTATMCGRVIAYQAGDGYVYWAGDATRAYGPDSGLARFVRHVVFVDNAWFAVFDDLRMRDDVEPGTFQWLLHIPEAVPLAFDASSFAVRYAIGAARMLVQHVGAADELTYASLRGAAGMTNPVTGEAVIAMDKWLKGKKKLKRRLPKPLDAHHVWVSHKTPQHRMRFLAVLAPSRQGEAEPVITRLGDTAVAATFRGRTKSVSFGGKPADIVVDADRIAGE